MAPETKLSKLQKCAAADDWRGAMRIASKFANLGQETKAIMRAWEAYTRPEFQQQLGRDPDALIAAGIAALKRRYYV